MWAIIINLSTRNENVFFCFKYLRRCDWWWWQWCLCCFKHVFISNSFFVSPTILHLISPLCNVQIFLKVVSCFRLHNLFSINCHCVRCFIVVRKFAAFNYKYKKILHYTVMSPIRERGCGGNIMLNTLIFFDLAPNVTDDIYRLSSHW